MPYKISVVLGGVVLAVAGSVLGGVGSAAASNSPAAAITGPALTSTPTPIITCPPALPISGGVAAVTTTSVTISYSLFFTPPCGYDPPITVILFASREDAQQWLNPVAEAVSGPERSGQVTVAGLTPGTDYWYRFSAGDHRDPYWIAAVRTASTSACAATIKIDSSWSSGFVATVTVRNGGTEALAGWRVSWRWPGDEQIQTLWNAEAHESTTGVTVGNTPYNAKLSPGGSTTFGMLVKAGQPPTGLVLTCAG